MPRRSFGASSAPAGRRLGWGHAGRLTPGGLSNAPLRLAALKSPHLLRRGLFFPAVPAPPRRYRIDVSITRRPSTVSKVCTRANPSTPDLRHRPCAPGLVVLPVNSANRKPFLFRGRPFSFRSHNRLVGQGAAQQRSSNRPSRVRRSCWLRKQRSSSFMQRHPTSYSSA